MVRERRGGGEEEGREEGRRREGRREGKGGRREGRKEGGREEGGRGGEEREGIVIEHISNRVKEGKGIVSVCMRVRTTFCILSLRVRYSLLAAEWDEASDKTATRSREERVQPHTQALHSLVKPVCLVSPSVECPPWSPMSMPVVAVPE